MFSFLGTQQGVQDKVFGAGSQMDLSRGLVSCVAQTTKCSTLAEVGPPCRFARRRKGQRLKRVIPVYSKWELGVSVAATFPNDLCLA